MSKHLTAAELEAVLNKEELSLERRREIASHLIRRCSPCTTVLAKALPNQGTVSPEEDAEYDRVITSAIEWILRLQEKADNGDSLVLAAAMVAFTELTHVFAEKGDRLSTYELLLKRSWAARHNNRREMVDLARAAAYVSYELDPTIHGIQKVADYQARAWGELGNAYRAANDYEEAHRAFGKSFQILDRGTGDRALRARLHNLYSSLLGDQRKFDFALQSLDIVFALYQEINDLHLAGRALLTKAIYTHYSGRSEDALDINQQGLTLINEKRDPSLPVVALHNHLCFLVACGRYKEAKILLFKNRRRIKDGGRILAIKLRWLEGQISYGMADYETAEATFQEVKEAFEVEDLGFAAALSSLDLAMAHMRLEKREEAKEVATKAAGVFAALQIHREVLGAVELLKDAFRVDMATVTLVERVAAFIREWEINPEARFFPSPE